MTRHGGRFWTPNAHRSLRWARLHAKRVPGHWVRAARLSLEALRNAVSGVREAWTWQRRGL
jgi:hypothetical protein